MDDIVSTYNEDETIVENLKIKEDFLAIENILEWFTWPMFPDAIRDINISFVTSKNEHFLLCTNGFLIMIPVENNEALLFKGRTVPYNSNIILRKIRDGYHWKGILHGETTDYTVKKADNIYRIEGDMGKYRSNYTINLEDDTITAKGDTGRFNSNLTITKFDRGYKYSGFAEGDKIELSFFTEEGRYFFEGIFGGNHFDIKIEMKDDIIDITGNQEGHKTYFTIKETTEGLNIEGVCKSKKVHYKVTRDQETTSYSVKGGFAGNIVEYTITHTD